MHVGVWVIKTSIQAMLFTRRTVPGDTVRETTNVSQLYRRPKWRGFAAITPSWGGMVLTVGYA